MPAPVLVTGATGKTGRRIVDRLTALGADVRSGGRHSDPPFDWADPTGWPAALRGVHAVYVCYPPDLAAPEAPAAISTLTAAAADAGVRRLVLLSGRGEAGARRCEDIVAGSGLSYTLVVASFFAQNFSEGMLRDAVLGGLVALPTGRVAEPFADVDDIADVAVAALTDDRHAGRRYEVTGRRALTFDEAAYELAKAAGRPVGYQPITSAQFRAALLDEVGPGYADLLTGLLAEIFDGRNAAPADGVRRALGREPRDFADFCRDAAAAGVWQD
ncbi:NmrA family transcriptional regulator [Micromonosporaceae bacterium Da 78-11]